MAFNMIIDLGIPVNAATLKRRFSEEELEIRLRVYWAAYGRIYFATLASSITFLRASSY
jgi:hypothetical protein